jgi:hypothetical protein
MKWNEKEKKLGRKEERERIQIIGRDKQTDRERKSVIPMAK